MPVPPVWSPDAPAFVITDVGSTTTKARLFVRDGDAWRVEHAESPTTVERPHEDVTIGVRRVFEALEQRSGLALWRDGSPAVPFLSTSSAGGGLAMVVTGLVGAITSRSAERVALGAGAVVLDVLAMDDGRTPYGKVQALESLRPDIVLLAGGFDGENISGPVFLAEMLNEAALRPKLSAASKLPVIYAGNAVAAPFVRETLCERFAVTVVDNLRPGANRENLGPAHDAIHETFMEHVMSQAPGYPGLLRWVAAPVLPTPSAFGAILALASRAERARILAIDIGGATTDVFTAEGGVVQRTVSANLGMSYSILEVLRRVGTEAVLALLDPPMDPVEVVDRIGGKLLHPTRLPGTDQDARMERAVAALAIREAVRDHLQVLRGASLDRTTEELRLHSILGASAPGAKAVPAPGPARPAESLRGYDLIIGSGGILSHAASETADRILRQGLQPENRTELAIDRGFVFPHLGVLTTAQPDLALALFHDVALERLGPVPRIRRGNGAGLPEAASGGSGRRAADPVRAKTSAGPGQQATHPERDEGAPVSISSVSPCCRVIRIRRELIIPGDVLVKAGESVRSDTIVARSTRLFPRPFFLSPVSALQCSRDEAASFVLKKPGDRLETGDLLARRKVSAFSTREFHAGVSGTIERILPDGTVVVRERPEMAQEAWLVNVAGDLKVAPKRLAPYLRCREGQEVEKGQWLAADTGRGLPRASCAPGRGRIESIDAGKGTIRILPLREELEVRAWLPGNVVEITPRGAIIEGSGVELHGVWGTGGETSGELTLGDPPAPASESAGEPASGRRGPGRIIAYDGLVTRAQLESWAALDVSGAIVPGVSLHEFLTWNPSFPVVVTEGFGSTRFAAERRALLTAHVGAWTLLDGTTEIRVGVRRPRFILTGEG